MIEEIKKNNVTLSYNLTRKNVKNINVRIKSDGVINVSANYSVSKKVIEDFLFLKFDQLIEAQNKFKNVSLPDTSCLSTGDTFYILGNKLNLEVIKDNQNKVIIKDEKFYLHTQDEDILYKQYLIDAYLKQQSAVLFQKIVIDVYPLFKDYDISFPEIKIRKMKSMWGSCMCHKKRITLNSELYKYPLDCIKYIIIHEFCHFKHPNHSKDFYNFQEKFIPNWKELKLYLKENRF